MTFKVDFYKNEESYRDGKKTITSSEENSFQPNYESGSENFIKQAYLFLKSKQEYNDAEDC